MKSQSTESNAGLPWYRAPTLWLALALPLVTVVAGVVTYRIAAEGASDAEPDDVRRVAQMQTADLGRDQKALQLGLNARATIDRDSGTVRVQLQGAAGEAALMMHFTHQTQAQFDQSVALERGADGTWTGVLQSPLMGACNVALAPLNGAWRVVGRLGAGAVELRLAPALGARDE